MARSRRDMTFDEWKQEQLRKAPASGGVRSPISPNAGMMGRTGPGPHPGAPATPYASANRGGNIGLPGPQTTPSKYTNSRPDAPPPYIDDVDMDENWYSPFQPIWPFGPPNIQYPREWDYPVGYNLNYIQPRMELMAMLRGMARTWGVLSTVITTRQDQLLRVPWTIQRRDKPRQRSAGVDEMKKFWRRPDGKLSYSQWVRKLLFDLFEIDAPTIYFWRNRGGKPIQCDILDGATIFPLIDDMGRRPDTGQPAYQQIIKGLPMGDFDEDELLYTPMRPRPDMPMFGYPPTEQILVEVGEAIRKTFYQLNFWQDGTIPDLIVTVPDNWTPRQIAMFQAHFDALLSGNLQLKSKCRFLPGGMKPFDIKNSSGESLWSQRDETLIRLCCYAYSVSPTPFVKQLNRSVAQNAQQTAQEEGLYPLMSWFKDDIMDKIIQDKFGYDDIEFVFLPRPEADQEKQSKILDLYVKNGIYNRNEARAELGQEPVEGGETYTIQVGNAIVPIESAAAGDALPVQGGVGQSQPSTQDKKPTANLEPNNQPQRGPARPTSASPQPSTVHKIGDILFKVTHQEVKDAAKESGGDIDRATHLQLKNGNYKKGHIWIQGLNISIENEKGSYRGEKDQQGKKWQVKMPCPYGYIRGTIGADNMQVDVYLGKKPNSNTVWVIDQDKVTDTGANKGFDETKVMLGYKSLKRALKDYLKTHFDGHGHERIRAITELDINDLKDWLKNGNMKEPISGSGYGTVVMRQKDIAKADTISMATNLMSRDQRLRPRKRARKAKRLARGPRWLELVA